jgi:CheY-like chemotaxis protein
MHKIEARFNARVLVAEDYQVNQQLAKRLLEKMGCSVDVAQNGVEVLNRIDGSQYDIIFMDCLMPEMDGYEATRRIRSQEKGDHTTIVAITANALEGEREKCLHAGMDDYISKPVKALDLEEMLEKYSALSSH